MAAAAASAATSLPVAGAAAERRYSLWLNTDHEPTRTLLDTAVQVCSQLAGTPAFHPHITLHSFGSNSPAAAVALSDSIVSCFTEFGVSVGACSMHPNHYFQCVFAVIDGDAAITAARSIAEHKINAPLTSHPHLSLCYGALPAIDRAQLIASIGRMVLKGLTYPVDSVLLVDTTTNQYTTWKCVKSYKLKPSNRTADATAGAASFNAAQFKTAFATAAVAAAARANSAQPATAASAAAAAASTNAAAAAAMSDGGDTKHATNLYAAAIPQLAASAAATAVAPATAAASAAAAAAAASGTSTVAGSGAITPSKKKFKRTLETGGHEL